MPLPLISLNDFVDLIPDPGPFAPVPEANWFPLTYVRECVALSESGMSQARRRLGNRWEHTHDRRIFIYSPFWIRAYFIDLNWSQYLQKKGGRNGHTR